MGCLSAKHEISGLKHPLGMESNLKHAGKLETASKTQKGEKVCILLMTMQPVQKHLGKGKTKTEMKPTLTLN